MNSYNLNDKIPVLISNKLNELSYNLENHTEFDKVLNELRTIYKEHPDFFSDKIIDKINCYKYNNNILRNKKPLPYIDYSNEYIPNHKYFNRIKRK